MSRYFITRHLGALEWATRQGYAFDQHLTHLDDATVFGRGDVVAGILPINLVGSLCEQGVRYFNLNLELPQDLRGIELSADQLEQCHASLVEYIVLKK